MYKFYILLYCSLLWYPATAQWSVSELPNPDGNTPLKILEFSGVTNFADMNGKPIPNEDSLCETRCELKIIYDKSNVNFILQAALNNCEERIVLDEWRFMYSPLPAKGPGNVSKVNCSEKQCVVENSIPLVISLISRPHRIYLYKNEQANIFTMDVPGLKPNQLNQVQGMK